ncbi:hypothetical protein I549_3124 [Mycobacterium avium subsp. avium 2285 (R)]|nr:hypothetical protein I549_3124 [Mycobacterium avium subsp. avium 2285 (R)]
MDNFADAKTIPSPRAARKALHCAAFRRFRADGEYPGGCL